MSLARLIQPIRKKKIFWGVSHLSFQVVVLNPETDLTDTDLKKALEDQAKKEDGMSHHVLNVRHYW